MKKIESIAEYQQLASRTCPNLGTEEKNLVHMNLGITTEVGEFLDVIKKNLAYSKPLDVVNLGEELADMAWYIANKSRLFYPVSWQEQEAIYKYEDVRKEFAEVFIPVYEKYNPETRLALILACVISPGPEDYNISDTVENFNGIKDMVILQYVAEMYDLDFFQILTNNIEKLKVRYPEKFTEKDALNRDLDAERKILEK